MSARAWAARRILAWQDSGGGRCPRTGGPHCSAYGLAAVQRWGVLVGAVAAARYVTTCMSDEGPCGDFTPRTRSTWRVLWLFARLSLCSRLTPQDPSRPCSDGQ